MSAFVAPILFTIFVWWFSTGLVLYAIRGSRQRQKKAVYISTFAVVLSLIGIFVTRDSSSAVGAYVAFLCALGIWGWNELSFLLGHVTGPVKKALPPGVGPLKRTTLAIGAVLYHELAITAGGLAVYMCTLGADNQVALWTYLVLWGMRITAKLNIYLGVSNFTDEFLPARLGYLKSYFGRSPVTPFFALSVTAGTVIAALLYHTAHGSAHQIAGAMLTGTLLTLALVEHWLLVLPIRESMLWKWAVRDTSPKPTTAPNASSYGI